MKDISGLLLISFASALLGSSVCAAAEMTPARAYERVQMIMSDNPHAAQWDNPALLHFLGALLKDEVPGPPKTGAGVIRNIADGPLNNAGLRALAVKALHWFHNDTVLQWVREYLQDPALEVSAATVLVRWGYWDEGCPTLLEHEEYRSLAVYDYDRAEAVLREAAENASPFGRINAGYELANHYGDHAERTRIARQLIDTYVLGDQPYPDTLNLLRALDCAYSVLQREEAPSEDMERFRTGVSNRYRIVRGEAFRGLFSLAKSGNAAATEEIMRLKDASPYPDVRNRAHIALQQMNAQR